MKRITSILIDIIFYSFLAILVAGLILFALGIKPYITMSGSMEPEIHTGSVCFVDTKATYTEIQVGEVIAFEASTGGLVTHRVIAITNEGMETKGDSNDVTDGVSTTPANFRGKTLFSIPYVGYVIKALQKPLYIAIGCIVLLGIFLFYVVDAYYEKAQTNAEECGDDSVANPKGSRKRKKGKYER